MSKKYKNPSVKDLIGMTLGRLTIIEDLGVKDRRHKVLVKCACESKPPYATRLDQLFANNRPTRSCGCIKSERMYESRLSHGMTNSKEFRCWWHMKQRCTNPNNSNYHSYGGRGIVICPEWIESFQNFYADMGSAPSPKHSVDRIDTNGNYTKNNCRWATNKEQTNNMRKCRYIEYNGERKTISQWADDLGVDRSVIAKRLDRSGWNLEDAIKTSPIRNIDKQTSGLAFKNQKDRPVTAKESAYTNTEGASQAYQDSCPPCNYTAPD